MTELAVTDLPINDSIKELLQDYPVQMELPVQWGDMDAFLHVNNRVYLKWIESCRVACFEQIGAIDYMQQHQVGPILGEVTCRYRIPLEHPDRISIGCRIVDLKAGRFDVEHRIVSHQHQKVACEGRDSIVFIDYANGGKIAIPEPVLAAISRL